MSCCSSLQVRRCSEQELSGGHPFMALSVGHCDWVLLFYLWSRSTEPYWSPPVAAGDSEGQHHSFPLGTCIKNDTLYIVTSQWFDFMLLEVRFVFPAFKWRSIFFFFHALFSFVKNWNIFKGLWIYIYGNFVNIHI